MKKVLFKISAMDRLYIFYMDDETNEINVYGYKKGVGGYFVNDEKEISLLNEVISKLNKRLIFKKEIVHNNEKYKMYFNIYDKMNYFFKIVDEEEVMCSYDDAKELYDKYNFPLPQYVGAVASYGTKSFGNADNFEKFKYRPRANKSDIAKQLILAVKNHPFEVNFTEEGWKYLSNNELQQVTPLINEAALEYSDSAGILMDDQEQTTGSQEEGQALVEVKENFFQRIFKAIKNFFTRQNTQDTPQETTEMPIEEIEDEETNRTEDLTDEQRALKDKYDAIREQLEDQGLEPWEITAALGNVSALEEESDDISFHLTEGDDVLYQYGPREKVTFEDQIKVDTTIPENVQEIIDVVNENPYLSAEEKEAVINLNMPRWMMFSDYLDINNLRENYSELHLNIEYAPGGKASVSTDYSPYEKAGGDYSWTYDEETWDPYSLINVYECHNLQEAVDNPAVLSHELNHANGRFGNRDSLGLLNEGFNEILTGGERYENEQMMAAMYMEAFGAQTLAKGYYQYDLTDELVNQVVQKTGRGEDEVREELEQLFTETQDVLYKMGASNDYKNDPEISSQLDQVINKLSNYHEMINGRSMEENARMQLLRVGLTGKDDKHLIPEGEEVFFKGYDFSTGRMKLAVGAKNKQYQYRVPEEDGLHISTGALLKNYYVGENDKYFDPSEIDFAQFLANPKDANIEIAD